MDPLNLPQLKKTATAYEDLLVPALFQPWANRLAQTDEIKSSHTILDVACGTGVLARAITRRGNGKRISGLDLNPGMLAVASQKNPGIHWQQGNAEALPFEDETFDVVLSQFGLMLFASPKKALEEMKRVLKPDGSIIIAVFDSIHNIPAYHMISDLFEQEIGPSVADALRSPFSMGNTEVLQALLSEVGLTNAEISTQKEIARFSSPEHMVFSDVKGWFPFAQIQLDDQTIQSIVQKAETVLQPFQTPTGSIQFDVSAHIIKAKKS